MTTAIRRAPFRVALAACIAAAAAGSVLSVAALAIAGVAALDPWWWASLVAAALAGAFAAAWVVRRAFGRRLALLAELLDRRVERSGFLDRVPDLGDDEVGQIARSLNALLARITTLQGDVIDRSRELEATQRALELAEELAQKQRELEQRLRERALLFEVLRESTSSHDLDRVLRMLVERIGPALRASRLAVLLRDDDGRYEVRAAHGFEPSPIGGLLARPSGGPLAIDRGMMLVPDVSRAPDAVGFWDALPTMGSFATIPISHGGDEIGLLVITRSAADPLGDVEARYLEAVADQAALAIHNAQLIARLEALSTHDELTGLPNRRLFWRRVSRALARAERYSHSLSVLAVDVDHFKSLNDRCGHAAGDEALRAIAVALTDEIREVDTAARVGGEELWVLLPETDEQVAAEVAEKLRARIAALDVTGADGQPLGHLSVSIGVATRLPGEAARALLDRADGALYVAKRAGRDRVESVPPAA
ncbi:MAG TPA: hypothetical protein DEF51_00710 [Myxococcales bacterium]|nr:hypothetical protein [Myxococcales bacterium]